MDKRNFLTDITIVGATLVSRCGDILHYSIPSLLKYCDWVLIMGDNMDEKTRNIVKEYQEKYPDKIRFAETGISCATEKQEITHRGLFRRFKRIQGRIRQTVFDYFYKKIEEGEKIDMLIWPDSDEVFASNFPDLLKEFWEMKNKQCLSLKPFDVYYNMQTICDRSMAGHGRCFRLFPKKLIGNPYRTLCNYRPLEKKDRVSNKYTLIHLCHLREKIKWRKENWKPLPPDDWKLWLLPKDAREMTSREIKDILEKDSDISVGEFKKKFNINI